MAPTLEEFQAWRANPVTAWILKGCQTAAEAQKQHWLEKSWNGDVDPLLRLECATRADAYLALEETTYEGWCDINEDNPVTE